MPATLELTARITLDPETDPGSLGDLVESLVAAIDQHGAISGLNEEEPHATTSGADQGLERLSPDALRAHLTHLTTEAEYPLNQRERTYLRAVAEASPEILHTDALADLMGNRHNYGNTSMTLGKRFKSRGCELPFAWDKATHGYRMDADLAAIVLEVLDASGGSQPH